jgi:CheY-like chemotaxis protein
MNLELLLKSCQPCVNNRPLILAVDDDEDNLLLLSEVLEPMSCSFISATHGQAAILLAQNFHPDLILLDVMLPDFNGVEVVKRLKQNPQTKEIPIVAVTALARAEDRERLLLAGCNEYISKPYMLDDLEEIVRRYLSLTSSVA